MRTVADLQRAAKKSGATLLSVTTGADGELVGSFSAPDVDDGQPMATAILLEELANQDAADVSPQFAAQIRTMGPTGLLRYVQDRVRFVPEDVETFQSPSVSLATGAGDCDDSERVLVVLARAAGWPARFVYFLQDGQPAHVTAQVRVGGAWEWSETTIRAKFGEHPFAAMKRLGMKRADMNGTPYVLQGGLAVPLQGMTMQGLSRGARGNALRRSRRMSGMGQVAWPSYLGDTFAQTLVNYSASIGADPLDILKLFMSESDLQPTAFNTRGFPAGQGAVGINQLSPGNWHYFMNDGLSLSDYMALTAEQQLPYAFKYFATMMQSHGLSKISGADLYFLNFLPAYWSPGLTDAHVIITSSSGFYAPNAGLDHGHKGFITKGDLQLALDAQEARHPTLWPLISSAILEDEGGPSVPVAGAIVAMAIFAGLKLAESSIPDELLRTLGIA